uniref:Transposase n=1 Tax=Syphacia muris TaxID=451379 RepID=A0A0N5AK24_9BILA
MTVDGECVRMKMRADAKHLTTELETYRAVYNDRRASRKCHAKRRRMRVRRVREPELEFEGFLYEVVIVFVQCFICRNSCLK